MDQPYRDQNAPREAKPDNTRYNSLSPQMYKEYEMNYGNNLEKQKMNRAYSKRM